MRADFWFDAISSTGASGDVNGDGQISIADVTALVNKILGKEVTLQSVVTNIDGLEYGGTSQESVPVR